MKINVEKDSEKLEKKASFRLENILNLLKNDIRTEIYELIIKIFHTPNYIIKAYLFIVSIVSVGLACYLLLQSIWSYLDYQVITTSRTIFETPTTFPKITICNSKMFTTQYGLDILKQANKLVLPSVDIMDDAKMSIYDTLTQFEFIVGVYFAANGMINSNNYPDENRLRISHNFEDILISCKFNYKTCTSADFIRIFDSNYGNCYVFNSGFNSSGNQIELKQSRQAGMIFGLQLKLYVNFNENLTRYNSYDEGYGAFIRIDNASYSIDHNIDGIKIAPGQLIDLNLNRVFKFTMPKPYSNCEIDESSPKVIDSDLYNLIANSSYQYSQSLCFQQCFQKQIFKECNCSIGVVKSFFDYKTCSTPTERICGLNLFQNKYLGSSFIQDVCVPLCPLECNVTEYNTRSTSLKIIPDLYVDYIIKNKNISADFSTKPIDADTASKSVVALNIFYETLSYTLITESPQMDIVSLLANIGGNLGLFLGVSLLSLCEIFEVFIEIVFIMIKT